MSKRKYEDYAKADCIPTGYNEAVTQYIFGQSTVDMLLDKIDVLEKALELAVETMRYELGRDAIKNLYKEAIDNLSSNLNMKFDTKMCEWFIEQAKEVLENE